jgi:hypothetical protein
MDPSERFRQSDREKERQLQATRAKFEAATPSTRRKSKMPTQWLWVGLAVLVCILVFFHKFFPIG